MKLLYERKKEDSVNVRTTKKDIVECIEIIVKEGRKKHLLFQY